MPLDTPSDALTMLGYCSAWFAGCVVLIFAAEWLMAKVLDPIVAAAETKSKRERS